MPYRRMQDFSRELVRILLFFGRGTRYGLDSPFHRAVFFRFLVSEIHPFDDSNGRLARIMMNAELSSANEERILIATVYRGNYIAAQRALSVGNSAKPLIGALDFARRWTAAMPWGSMDATESRLGACNAFYSEAEADKEGVMLQMPKGIGAVSD